MISRRLPFFLSLLMLLPLLGGCQSLRELAALRNVQFSLDQVTNASLAGVDVSRLRSYEQLGVTDLARLTAAVATGDVPLEFTLHLGALNPEENDVQARLVEMDWTLFLEDRETVSGVFDQNIVLPPGLRQDVPIGIRLDLVEFFDRNARDLVELVLAVTGQGGEPKNIRLQATPTIDTPIGPIRYPQPITIVNREMGEGTGG